MGGAIVGVGKVASGSHWVKGGLERGDRGISHRGLVGCRDGRGCGTGCHGHC